MAHIEMGIKKIRAQEPAVIRLTGIIAEFRHNGKVAPVGGIILTVIVPGQPAAPGLDAGVNAQGKMLANSHFQADVRFGYAVPKEIGANGNARIRGLCGGRTPAITVLLGRSDEASCKTSGN